MKIYRIAKDKISDFFSYGEEIRTLWNNLLHDEMDRVNIHFDLENNDGYDTKTKDLDFEAHDGEKKFRVKAQICWAGGDWESPICYFRCQFEDRTYFERDESWGKWNYFRKAVIIPIKSNKNLIKNDKGMIACESEDNQREDSDKKLWDEMVEMAEKRLKEYWDAYAGDGDESLKSTGFMRDLASRG